MARIKVSTSVPKFVSVLVVLVVAAVVVLLLELRETGGYELGVLVSQAAEVLDSVCGSDLMTGEC
jgi:hypothetical protein